MFKKLLIFFDVMRATSEILHLIIYFTWKTFYLKCGGQRTIDFFFIFGVTKYMCLHVKREKSASQIEVM